MSEIDVPSTLSRTLEGLTKELSEEKLGVSSWESAFELALTQYHLAMYAHGAGIQVRDLTENDYDLVQSVLDRQKEFLKGFAQAWREGRYTNRLPTALHRTQMYADAVIGTWWMGNTRGWPLPAWPGDGTTQCKTHCNCSWHIEQLEGVGNADAYWGLGGTDHCQTCLQRSEDWSPLQIRNGELLI